ncbi:MAG: cation diffusion facilitator family transporter [Pyrinomonadaceae bacterium]
MATMSGHNRKTTIRAEETARKTSAARLSIFVAAFLILLKTSTGFLTGSISVWASVLDSSTDLIASIVNLIVVHAAARPADEDHAYGHGKAESLGSLFQSLAIAASGIFLIYEAVRRLIVPHEMQSGAVGVAAMIVAILVSLLLAARLKKVARETESPALESDAAHYSIDVYTTAGALLALLITTLTDWKAADSIISIVISVYILWSAVSVARESIDVLMDRYLGFDVGELVAHVVNDFEEKGVRGFHELRTRRSGSQKFIDLHLEVDRHKTFQEAHDLTVTVIHEIEAQVPRARVHIHTDPAD